MKKLSQNGAVNPMLIASVLLAVGFIVTSVLAVIYYGNFTEQRDNNQPLIEAAVEKAKNEQKTALEADFAEREKLPTKNYVAPGEFGSIRLSHPKTWSSYVDNKGDSINFYAHPNFVPSENVNYALRMSVVSEPFSEVTEEYQDAIEDGELKSSTFQAAGVSGSRLDGLLEEGKTGSMVIFPLRDKTLRVWTETTDFRSDFDNIVLKNLTFVP